MRPQYEIDLCKLWDKLWEPLKMVLFQNKEKVTRYRPSLQQAYPRSKLAVASYVRTACSTKYIRSSYAMLVQLQL